MVRGCEPSVAKVTGLVPFYRRYSGFQTHLSRCRAPFMEDHAVEVVGEMGKRQFGRGSRKADGANKQTISSFLMRKDMLDPGPHR